MKAIIKARELYLKFRKDSSIFQPVNLNEICKYFGIEIYPWKTPKNISACLISDGKFPYIAVCENDMHNYPRRSRFSIGHEICHFLLHPKNNYFCSGANDSKLEVEANYFSAELIVPAFELKKLAHLYKIKQLCDIFDVSEQVMGFRLSKMNLICKD